MCDFLTTYRSDLTVSHDSLLTGRCLCSQTLNVD